MTDPFELLGDTPSPIQERRQLTVFGAPAELAFIPARSHRRNVPGRGRPPFKEDFGLQILEAEALFREDGVAWTPNKFPFGRDHGILWRDGELRREADELLLARAFAITSAHGATAFGNCIGAAASIQRAHLHLVRERLPFLTQLQEQEHDAASGGGGDNDDTRTFRILGAFTGLRIEGSPDARAASAARWIALRLTATFNVIDDGTSTWVFPRGQETPAPHFPFALGAAELWGRWCYADEDAFRAATAPDLERALEAACVRWPEG